MGDENPSPEPKRRLPTLLRFLALNMALGAAIGVAFASVVVLSNTAGLKDLIATSSEPLLPLFLLLFFNALTFAGITMGVAIMRLPWDGR
jgi:hypothetical protein